MTTLRGLLERALTHIWYERSVVSLGLLPLSLIVHMVIKRRRRKALPKGVTPEGVKVIIVGGLTVGGTGKTPILIALGSWLQSRGLRVGVLSRGYRSDVGDIPTTVLETHDARQVGDEPLLIRRSLGAPVVVCRDRRRALDALIEQEPIDVVLSDDGLQHYSLPRDMEIIVLDADRGLGNGRLIPAGPLREPASRLESVDWVLIRNSGDPDRAFSYTISGVREWVSGRYLAWSDCLDEWRQQSVTAMTGLGQPRQFFDMLTKEGLSVAEVALPDHERITVRRLERVPTDIVVVTRKDAVKLDCTTHSPIEGRLWVVEIEAVLPASLLSTLESVFLSRA
ncbi:MAG: tetraacyldisaccharide 4'-kinase [Luminiphilus sp.]|nr:tetraacyldisaccharide 4'-kinase [Luminiphilus sp.]